MNAKNKILLVVNPISGNFDKGELIDLIKKEIHTRDKKLKIYETSGKKDIENITAHYRRRITRKSIGGRR